jgi:hypothetical protein
MTLEAFPMTTTDPATLGNAILQRLREAVAGYEATNAKMKEFIANVSKPDHNLDRFKEGCSDLSRACDNLKDVLAIVLGNKPGGVKVGRWFYALELGDRGREADPETNKLSLHILDPDSFFDLPKS